MPRRDSQRRAAALSDAEPPTPWYRISDTISSPISASERCMRASSPGSLDSGRQVHRPVGEFPVAVAGRGILGAASREGAPTDRRIEKAAPACLGIAARHRCEVQAEPVGQRPLRRERVAVRQPAGAQIVGDGIGDGEIGRAVGLRQVGMPVLHSMPLPSRPASFRPASCRAGSSSGGIKIDRRLVSARISGNRSSC